jgi:cytochrome P450
MKAVELDIDFRDRAFIDDPYPFYEEIRAAGRVVWNSALGFWMVTSFDDCKQVLRDRGVGTYVGTNAEVAFWFDAPNMLTADGDNHRRLRDSLAPVFTKTSVAQWERRVTEVVDELLTPLVEGHDDFDLIADFTMIPTVIVAELLGIPRERHEDFRRWSNTIAGGIAYGFESPEVLATMRQASEEVNAYLTEEIERHREGTFDDVFGTMMTMSAMTPAEMRSTALLLLLAGYDTTAKLMSTALVVFEQHPAQRRLLVENPSLMPDALEEVLRWAGVSHMLPCAVAKETQVAGTTLAPGDIVYVLTAAANRDPSHWPDPERFDIQRERKSHLSFGYGPHLCIGLWLARLEARIALQRLLEIAPEYRLRDVEVGRSFFLRGPERGVLDVAAPTSA